LRLRDRRERRARVAIRGGDAGRTRGVARDATTAPSGGRSGVSAPLALSALQAPVGRWIFRAPARHPYGRSAHSPPRRCRSVAWGQHPLNQVGCGRLAAAGCSSTRNRPPASFQPMVAIQVLGGTAVAGECQSDREPVHAASSTAALIPLDRFGLRGSEGLDSADVLTGVSPRQQRASR
jgi:hypothetical protein